MEYDISEIRKALESLFDTQHAEDVEQHVLTLLHVEREISLLNNISRKRVLLALCRQHGVSINEKELFNIKDE